MADKEPRRRKKRRDSQKKDDVRSEDQLFVPPKSEPRDSDQEAEEEIVIHSSHQPSNVAKIVFVILFSGLVVSLSVIFISLQGAEKGPIDIFDIGHDDHHGEAVHDHIEDILHDDHDDHEENEVSLEDILPGLSSILSLNNEQVKETENMIPSDDLEEVTEDKETEDVRSYIVEPESSTDQGILEEYVEDISEQLPPDSIEEPVPYEVYPDTTTSIPYPEESYSTFDYSDAEDFPSTSVQPDEVEPTPEPFTETTKMHNDDIQSTVDVNAFDDDNDQGSFSFYERADITNEADYEIKEQLDEVDEMVEKESDDDDDEDEEEEDDDVEEEFDFWQF